MSKRLLDGDTQGDRSAQMIRAKLRIQPEGSGLTIDIGGDYTSARETSAPSDLLGGRQRAGHHRHPFPDQLQHSTSRRAAASSRPTAQPTLNPSFITASPFETWAGGPNHNDLDLWGAQGNRRL